ncbi:hypothetical protein [Candidatus Tisiphia endosymbiont of Nemotelus uliginosus]|uniref:hypothetical protein n=1 Tax=Candidatus Tisiphia endosymbiont of Nemotelus uliginosus TaxID=3077926 RepID=UPI0035C8EE92
MKDKPIYLADAGPGPWSQEIVRDFNALITAPRPTFFLLRKVVETTIVKWLRESKVDLGQYNDKGENLLLVQAISEGCPELFQVVLEVSINLKVPLVENIKRAKDNRQLLEQAQAKASIQQVITAQTVKNDLLEQLIAKALTLNISPAEILKLFQDNDVDECYSPHIDVLEWDIINSKPHDLPSRLLEKKIISVAHIILDMLILKLGVKESPLIDQTQSDSFKQGRSTEQQPLIKKMNHYLQEIEIFQEDNQTVDKLKYKLSELSTPNNLISLGLDAISKVENYVRNTGSWTVLYSMYETAYKGCIAAAKFLGYDEDELVEYSPDICENILTNKFDQIISDLTDKMQNRVTNVNKTIVQEMWSLVQEGTDCLISYMQEPIYKWTMFSGAIFEGSLIFTAFSSEISNFYNSFYSGDNYSINNNGTCSVLLALCSVDQESSDYL